MRFLALLLGLAACAPLPESGERVLSSQGIRPGITSSHDMSSVVPPTKTLYRYRIETPLRRVPSELAVTVRDNGNGRYLRDETVRIPETSRAEARIVATMARQRGRPATVVGTDVIIRSSQETDKMGRTLFVQSGDDRTTYRPHDCRATLGTCKMTRTGPEGTEEPLVVRTTELGGIWREEIRHDRKLDPASRGALIQESLYSMDEDAMLIDMNRLDHEKTLGTYQEIRRVE